MYLPQQFGVALIFMIVTMLFWGSWANVAKADSTWRFELLYWDYAFGVLVTSFLFAITMGSLGHDGLSFWQDLKHIHESTLFKALISGAIFDLSNFLIIAAIAVAGLAVAFPIGIGLALVLGTIFSYFINKQGSPFFIFLGVGLVLVAIVLTALAYKKKQSQENAQVGSIAKGVWLAIIGGVLMSFFYPFLASALQGTDPFTPYTATFFFGVGLFVANFAVNAVFMKMPIHGEPLAFKQYFQGTLKQHSLGLFGGFLWCTALALNLIASTQVGPAIAFALGQGATLIAAIWGVFIWREFSKTQGVTGLLSFMFLFYLAGLVSIATANFF